jgi:hypothetical protein
VVHFCRQKVETCCDGIVRRGEKLGALDCNGDWNHAEGTRG